MPFGRSPRSIASAWALPVEQLAQKKSTDMLPPSSSSALSPSGEATCEKRSFFGAGGEGPAWWAALVGGVEGSGWVSWPVRLPSCRPSGGVP